MVRSRLRTSAGDVSRRLFQQPVRVEQSVVIPTRNHPQRLAKCLTSLLEAGAEPGRCEILVMDNSDKDVRAENAAVVAAFPDDVVRHVRMDSIGLMAARHEGVAAGRGELVSFIDDDELVLPTWLEGVRGCFRDPTVGLVTGPFLPLFEADQPGWLNSLWVSSPHGHSMGYLTLLDYGEDESWIDADMVWGGNLSIRRTIFYEVGGSHPDYLPPPWQAFQGDGEGGLTVRVRAAGYRARYSPACGVLHAVPGERMTLEYLERRAWFIGLHSSFTHARREHLLGPTDGVPDLPIAQKRPLSRRIASHLRRSLCRGILPQQPGPILPSCALAQVVEDVKRRLAQAHQDGWDWHREKLSRSPSLREYVCRRDFLGANAVLPSNGCARDANV